MAALALAQYGSGAVITAVLHPFGYAKVLMQEVVIYTIYSFHYKTHTKAQVGHEPLLPSLSTTFFFKKEVLVGPNIFKYLGHIKKVDGFFGMYRGVFPRVLAGTVGNLVQYNIQDKFKAKKEIQSKGSLAESEDDDFVPWLKTFAKETSEDTVGRVCGVIVSHPFHVIMVRCMVQFIGRETQYDSMWSSIKAVYEQNGILGFFAGLVPRLIGEVITIWVTGFLAQLLNKYAIREKDMKSYTGAACGLVISHFTYPFTLVTNIMAVSGSGLRAGQFPLMPTYDNWSHCMRSLSQAGELKRGANAFWRIYKGPKEVGVIKINAPVISNKKSR